MHLNLEHRIARGAFADIFSPPPGDKVYKLFRRLVEPVFLNVEPHIFKAETAAYEIAVRHSDLRSHVPAYYGPVAITRVSGNGGSDESQQYRLDLCYAVERIDPDPEERKFGSFYNELEWHLMEPLEQLFESAGIGHLGDASVLHWRSGHPIVIDFAVSDAAADHAHLPPEAA